MCRLVYALYRLLNSADKTDVPAGKVAWVHPCRYWIVLRMRSGAQQLDSFLFFSASFIVDLHWLRRPCPEGARQRGKRERVSTYNRHHPKRIFRRLNTATALFVLLPNLPHQQKARLPHIRTIKEELISIIMNSSKTLSPSNGRAQLKDTSKDGENGTSIVSANGLKKELNDSNGKTNGSNGKINGSNGKKSGSNGSANGANGASAMKGKNEKTKFVSLASGLSEVNADQRIAGSFSGHHTVSSLAALYDEFAEDYEKAYSAVEYEGPKNVAEALRTALPSPEDNDSIVLDAGCGSGLVGEAVRAQGFKRIVGIDVSEGMMEHARSKKGLYERVQKADLTKPLSLGDNEFDAVVSCGVFTAGHVDKTALFELIRVVRSGGLICIGCQEHVYEREGFPDFIATLEKEGRLKQIRRTIAYAMRKTKTQMTIVTLRVC